VFLTPWHLNIASHVFDLSTNRHMRHFLFLPGSDLLEQKLDRPPLVRPGTSRHSYLILQRSLSPPRAGRIPGVQIAWAGIQSGRPLMLLMTPKRRAMTMPFLLLAYTRLIFLPPPVARHRSLLEIHLWIASGRPKPRRAAGLVARADRHSGFLPSCLALSSLSRRAPRNPGCVLPASLQMANPS
jgi:hypothetical protein